MDGLSYGFTLLITGIGTLVLVYAAGYFRGKAGTGRIFGWLVFFLAAMLGLVWSDNLILLFVFWELTSIASFMLIGFKHEDPASRASARQALAVTGAGSLAMLAGFLVLAMIGRDSGLSGVEALTVSSLVDVDVAGHRLYLPALVLILAGAVTKSAQMPFHFWLPGAMTAPTPVSAFLHSATMVKAGVYLLARMHPVLGSTPEWTVILVVVGGVTMVVSAVLCAGKRDLKLILAYSTVSVLGILTLLLGLGTESAIKAAVVFLFAHALYKASLFMVAGNVDAATGTRDVVKLGGLSGAMRWTAVAALFAALSKAGAPPLFGFLGKELLYKAKLAPDPVSSTLLVLAFFTNIVLVAMALVVAIWPFWGRRTEAAAHVRRLPVTMVIGPLILAVLGIFIGIVPGTFDAGIGSATATAIAGYPVEMKLKLWHGLNPEALAVVGMSALTLAAGFGVFLALRRHIHLTGRLSKRLGRFGPRWLFDVTLEGAVWSGKRAVTLLLSLGLRGAVAALLVMLFLVAVPVLRLGLPTLESRTFLSLEEIALVLLIVGGGVLVLVHRSSLVALVSVGTSGLGLALLFAVFGAPDLAMTQIMVEVLALIVLLLVVRRVPALVAGRSKLAHVGRVAAALGVGVVMAAVTFHAAGTGAPADTAAFYLEQSYPTALGRNVVNTILVDFRALDTLGEIVVVAVAGLGVIVLMGRARWARDKSVVSGPILRSATRFLVVLLVLLSAFLLLRGHNEPGGGFAGGLVLTAGFALHLLTFGPSATRALVGVRPETLIGAGLVSSLAAGLAGFVSRGSFLASLWLPFSIPGLGKVGTVLLFDLGIYLIVFGVAISILLLLSKERA
jgi:multicomponent Na+:H+ antiporter subunit A